VSFTSLSKLVAKALPARGLHLVIAGRDEASANAAAGRPGSGVEARTLDSSERTNVRAFAPVGRLDILVLDAVALRWGEEERHERGG
jgi:NADP-dependent 3-hydroxy acid dehydrogenase YdfG